MRYLLIGLVCSALALGCGTTAPTTPTPTDQETTPVNAGKADKGGKPGANKKTNKPPVAPP